ncbi:hypothetical protein D9M69_414630 [compost metagenome]
MRFHPAGGIDSRPPQVVDEFSFPDDAGDHWAAVYANAHLQVEAGALVEMRERVCHVQRHMRGPHRVVRRRLRQPRGCHVGVADGLDLLKAAIVGNGVEFEEDLIEDGNQLLGAHACRETRKRHDVREQNSHVRKAVGDEFRNAARDQVRTRFQPFSDRVGQQIEQQPLRQFLLGENPVIEALELVVLAANQFPACLEFFVLPR